MEILRSSADDSPLIYTEAGSFLTPEQQEEEALVPPVSSYCNHVKIFCCVKFRYPLLVTLLNIFALGLCHALLDGSMLNYLFWSFRPSEDSKEEKKKELELYLQVKLVLTVGLSILTAIFAVDAYVFWRCARRLEKKAAEQQHDLNLEEEDGQGTARPSGAVPTSSDGADASTGFGSDAGPNREHKVDYVKMSKAVDTAFGCTGDVPTSTFLVCLLYALFAVATYKSVGSATVLVGVQLSNSSKIGETAVCFFDGPMMHDYNAEEKAEEYGIASLQKNEEFSSWPPEIQDWIKAHANEFNRPPRFNRSVPYLQAVDGSMVFDFKKRTPSSPEDPWSYSPKKPGLAIWYPANDSITEFLADVGTDYWDESDVLELVGFPKQPPYTGWCGVFKMPMPWFYQDEAICYRVTNGNHSQLKHFPPVKGEPTNDGAYSSSNDESMYATDDSLWVATRKTIEHAEMYSPGISNRGAAPSTVVISLVVFHLATMEKRLEATRNITKSRRDEYNPRHRVVNPVCKKGYRWEFATSLIALGVVSYYLYRLDVSSCVLPACLALAMMADTIFGSSPWPWAASILLAMAGGCLYVLVVKRGDGSMVWKYASQEMMIWALYSFLIGASYGFLTQIVNREYLMDLVYGQQWQDFLFLPFVIFVAALVIAVLLDHPIFPILAYGLGAVGVLSSATLSGGLRFLIIPVVIFTLSLGCFRTGGIIQQYRVHLIVYGRRLGRCICDRCCFFIGGGGSRRQMGVV